MIQINKKKLVIKTLLTISVISFSVFCLNKTMYKEEVASPTNVQKEVKQVSLEEDKCKEYIQQTGQKEVYLTFDDGPNIYTDQILNILEEKKVRGTFFVVGNQLPLYSDELKEVIENCHYVGMHTMTHQANKLYNSIDPTFVNELIQLQGILKNTFNYETNLARAPYGSTYINNIAVTELKENDFKLWDWTVDSLDWKYGPGSYQQIINNVTTQLDLIAGRYDANVILMHERDSTVKALPYVIDTLRNKGYVFKVYKEQKHFPVNFKLDQEL